MRRRPLHRSARPDGAALRHAPLGRWRSAALLLLALALVAAFVGGCAGFKSATHATTSSTPPTTPGSPAGAVTSAPGAGAASPSGGAPVSQPSAAASTSASSGSAPRTGSTSASVGVSGNQAAAGAAAPAAAQVRLVVTRNFGSQVMLDITAPFTPGMTVMRLLAEHARVDTGYGGQFVSGINGVRSTFGTVSSSQAADWFYWVNGRMADVGADAYKLHGGDTVWWDYHRWAGAMFIPLSLDAFPAPFAGTALTVVSDFSGGALLQRWAASNGLTLGRSTSLASAPAGTALVLASAAQAQATPWLKGILSGGPQRGVFVTVSGGRILALNSDGSASTPVAGVAIAAPNPKGNAAPLLIVVGQSGQDISNVLAVLTPAVTAHRIGVALPLGSAQPVSLPLSGAGAP